MTHPLIQPFRCMPHNPRAAAAAWGNYANLVAAWKFESNANDSHSNGLNLTEVNAPSYVAGQVGNCVDLEASSSQRLTHSGDAAADLSTVFNTFFWINLESTGGEQRVYQVGGGQLIIRVTSGAQIQIYWGGTRHTDTTVLSTGTWYHVGVGFDGTDYWSSIDNGTKETTTMSAGSSATNPELEIGGESWGVFVDGKLDDMTDWRRDLTDQERTDIYNGNGPY